MRGGDLGDALDRWAQRDAFPIGDILGRGLALENSANALAKVLPSLNWRHPFPCIKHP